MQNKVSNKTVMIMAGGSGGHIFPGLSIARHLIKDGYNVVWLGALNSIESKLVPDYGIDIKFIQIQGLRGKKIYRKFFVLLYAFFLSLFQALKIIRFWKPDIVLGMGGYVSGPGGLAAWLCGIPLIIHEQNKVIGLTNWFLSFFAKKVLQGFPKSVVQRAIIVGNPVRSAILSIPDPIDRWKNRIGPIRVLVMGGSQGAHVFNLIMPKIARKFSDKLVIWHQSGKKDFKNVIKSYQKIKKNHYRIESFIKNIDKAYEWADLVISRSGALTVSEIACAGLPAIFIPFPFHQDRQQYWNAIALERIGAAKIIEQRAFTIHYISMILESLNRKTLLDMANRAKSLAIPNATQLVTRIIIQYL